MTDITPKKITFATVKSFIRTAVGFSPKDDLHIHCKSTFDSIQDMVVQITGGHHWLVSRVNMSNLDTLGILGAWFVRGSEDYFKFIDSPEWTGFEIYNSYGTFELVVPAKSQKAATLRIKFGNGKVGKRE